MSDKVIKIVTIIMLIAIIASFVGAIVFKNV